MTKPESLYPVCLHPFRADVAAMPERMVNPFTYDPHPLAKQAAEELQAYIAANADVKAQRLAVVCAARLRCATTRRVFQDT